MQKMCKPESVKMIKSNNSKKPSPIVIDFRSKTFWGPMCPEELNLQSEKHSAQALLLEH
jgi:hypothetical protein